MKKIIIRFLVFVMVLGSIFNIVPSVASANSVESQPVEGMYEWILDEENGNIYAFSYNQLTVLSVTDLTVKQVIPIDEYLMDAELVDGKLYILDSYNNVQIINATTLTVEKSILLDETNYVWDIAVDKGKIFFTFEGDSNLYFYDLTNNLSGTALSTLYYDAVLTADTINNTLYIAESGKAASRIEAISTIDYQNLSTSTSTFDYPEPIIYFDNGNLFYGGKSINGTDLNIINGDYSSEIWFLHDLYVVTENGLYDRTSFNKLNDVDYILIDNANYAYTFTENETIVKAALTEYLADYYYGNLTLPEPSVDIFKYSPNDLNNGWADEYLNDFLAADFLTGSKDQEGNVLLQPNKQITRAEFVTILVRILGLTDDTGAKDFIDVSSGKWFYESVRIANANGLITGLNENEFAPERPIRRDEMATIIVRAFEGTIEFNGEAKQFTDVGNYWGKTAIDKASSIGIITGTTNETFSPFSNAKRSEAVTMLYRAVRLESSNLPLDSELTNTITTFYSELDASLNAYQFEQINTVLDQYTTGYYNAYHKYNNDVMGALYSTGRSMQTVLVGQPVYTVVEKSNTFATIEVEGLIYENTSQFGLVTETLTQDLSGTYYLKRAASGEWKIYKAINPNL